MLTNAPDAVELCLNCTEEHCDGTCEKLRQRAGKDAKDYVTLTYMGHTYTIREWADMLGLNRTTIYHRLKNGAEPCEALRNSSKLTIEQTTTAFQQLNNMNFNYAWYIKIMNLDGSRGMVAKYGQFASQPTNRVNQPTETMALALATLTDEQKVCADWVECALIVLHRYKNFRYPGRKPWSVTIEAEILEKKVLNGRTLEAIRSEMNQDRDMQISKEQMKRHMRRVVEDVADEAVRHGLC